MMTCFTPSAMRSDHVHFIDGARGGYASAATALKAMAAEGRFASRGSSPPTRVQVSPPQSAPTQPSTRSVSAPASATLLA